MVGQGGGGCCARLAFLPADTEADAEIKLVSVAGLGFLIVFGSIGYALHKYLGPQARFTMLAALLPIFPMLPFLVLEVHGQMRSKMAHFTLSFFGVMASLRWFELLCGTGPQGFDRSFKNFIVYFASPAEVLFDDEGRFKSSKKGLLGELVLRIAVHMMVGTIVLSLGNATAFVPFLEPGTDPMKLPWFGLPTALPALYLQTTFVYCMLATAMLMHRLPLALVGVDTVDSMQAPLLLSTTIREFWGRRWNLVVHRLMKRSFFTPFAKRGPASRHLGGLFAFIMSGLFHEYMWLAVNWTNTCHYSPGLPTLFFLIQFLLCAMEAILARTALGRCVAEIPRPLLTVATTLAILPMGPLFLHGLLGMARECAEQGQTIVLVPSGSPTPHGAGVKPPLDWMFLALGAVLVVIRRVRSANKSHTPSATSTCQYVLPVAEQDAGRGG